MTTNLKVQKLLATLNPILMIIMNASVIAIIMIGGFQVEAKAMPVSYTHLDVYKRQTLRMYLV